MNRSYYKSLSLVLCLAAAGLLGSCTDDSIPSSPSPPYLFSDLRISKNISPVPGTTMSRGSNVTLRFEVAYTLGPGHDAMFNKLAIFADAYSSDSTGAFLAVLKSLGATPPALNSVSTVAAESLNFTVPQNARFITLETYIDSLPPLTNFVVSIDTKVWPVQ
jgi:hypothetical protein